MQNPCRRQAIIITLGANATTCRRQAIYILLCGAERDQRKRTASHESLSTWANPSSVEKLNEARRSKENLKQKKGWRTKHREGTRPQAKRVVETKMNTVNMPAERATFLIQVKSHRGEPINERVDTLTEWRRDGKISDDDIPSFDDRIQRWNGARNALRN
jgi:hypothetical protein